MAATLLTSSMAIVGFASADAAPTSAEDTTTGLVGSYVVVLRERGPGTVNRPVAALARSIVDGLGGAVTQTYTHALRGFAVRLPVAAVPALRLNPLVATVSPDLPVTATDTQRNPSWGLDRIDQAGARLDGRYSYPSRGGAGAHVYVVDSGLSGHPDLSGRVGTGRNFVGGLLTGPDPDAWGDCSGHGTHVASTVAGATYGVAKRTEVHAVRVLDCGGAGATSEVLAGLDWVARSHQSPAVANMSFGTGGREPATEAAVRGLLAHGVAVVVAAGNSHRSACLEAPAAEPAAVTVAATNRSDARAGFSNYGPCVDIFAPGVDIPGSKIGSDSLVHYSGTSMSAPHVAGALALLRAEHPGLSARKAQEQLLDGATRGVVSDRGPGSPNRLLRVHDDSAPKARFTVRCDGRRCTFRAGRSVDDEGIRRYQWEFGRRLRGHGPTVTHTYRAGGKQTVTLTVVDRSGQRDTARRTFRVTR